MARNDTSPEIMALQAEVHRRMGSQGRLTAAMGLSQAAREMALGRISKSNPGKSDREILGIYFSELLANSRPRHS